LDLREFLLAIDLVAARTPEEKLLWAFRMHDTDNSGLIDPKEMNHVMKDIYNMLEVIGAAPKNNSDDGAKKIFNQIDINSDGLLTMEEFLKGCMKDDELMLLLEKLFTFLTEGMD
jgi:Ca2+-binding EF-hand superfamily protein